MSIYTQYSYNAGLSQNARGEVWTVSEKVSAVSAR